MAGEARGLREDVEAWVVRMDEEHVGGDRIVVDYIAWCIGVCTIELLNAMTSSLVPA